MLRIICIVIMTQSAYADHFDNYAKPVIKRETKFEYETSIFQKTKVKNNINLPNILKPMEFYEPAPIKSPLRRQLQFINNIPKHESLLPQQQLPQQQEALLKQKQLRQAIIGNHSNAFIIQNVVTAGTNIEAIVINNGFQKSKAASKTIVNTKEKIIESKKNGNSIQN